MTENVIGRKIEDVDARFLESFFQEEKGESDVLEFKSGGHEKDKKDFKDKINDVLESICAFLNSSGGVLIWGAPIGSGKGKEKVFVGSLSPVDQNIEKDSFINKISDSIIPPPGNIRFLSIEIEKHKFVYLIEVLESITKPHQFKNVYYMRLDGQTRPAPHHYIEALFKQIRFPRIEGFVRLNKREEHANDALESDPSIRSPHIYLDITILICNFSPYQNEENISFILMCPWGIIQGESTSNYIIEKREAVSSMMGNEVKPILYFGQPYWKNVTIKYSRTLITGIKGIADILFVFGGKLSPQKSSSYKLDLFREVDVGNMNDMIIEHKENKTHYEIQLEKGQNREVFLKWFLNR